MLLNGAENFAAVLGILSAGIAALTLIDDGWATIRDIDGRVYNVGLLSTRIETPAPNNSTTETSVSNVEDVLFAGRVTALCLLGGGAAVVTSVVNLFLVGSGNLSREKGHNIIFKFSLLGGAGLLVACMAYSLLFPSDWPNHDQNEVRQGIGNNFTIPIYVYQLRSVDHLSDDFIMTIVSSCMSFFITLSIYFAYPRSPYED